MPIKKTATTLNRKTNNKAVLRKRTQNTILRGLGGETIQDRSAHNTAANYTLHPYYNNNYLYRWQEYTRWYMTSWEAKKLVEIPVQDALRDKVELKGLSPEDELLIWEAYEKYNVARQLHRALIQERLLGGCLLMPIMLRPQGEETGQPFDIRTMLPGDLKSLNVVDVGRLSRAEYNTNPFDPFYDELERIQVNATIVHTSRLLVFDNEPLFNFTSQRIMENYRFNPVGFGESILSPLYDTLIRATGTQQGAYHLVNLTSCLIMACTNLRAMNATMSPAKAKLEEIAEQLSIYRAALIDAKEVEFKNYSATFGSVPELVMTFLQILSAGSDIPATRFLGQAPGGLNATGQSDLENYYNHIASWQKAKLEPRQRKIFDWLGCNIWGWPVWEAKSKEMELVYAPLWNISKTEQAQVDNTYGELIRSLVDIGIIDQQSGLNELKERKIFTTDVQAGDFLSQQERNAMENPFGEGGFGGEFGDEKQEFKDTENPLGEGQEKGGGESDEE